MNLLPIHRFPDPLLKQPTHQIEQFNNDLRQFIERLIRTMRHYPRCVGLAAPQVGSTLRLAVMDASGHPKARTSHGLLVLINPRLDAMQEPSIQREGCLSLPDFTANVRRAMRVHMSALDQFGMAHEWWLEGFEAIVAQHEVDHLDGRLFLDRVTNVKTDVFRRKTYS